MKFNTHSTDLYILPENDAEEKILIQWAKIVGIYSTVNFTREYSNVEGQNWFGKMFYEIPFGSNRRESIEAALKLHGLSVNAGEYLRLNSGTSEFDKSINDISREKIEAAKIAWGQVWLGKINLYGDERKETYEMVEYAGQRVYNFEYGFISPAKDEQLEKMIDDKDKSTWISSADDQKTVDDIFNRMDEIGAIVLLWS